MRRALVPAFLLLLAVPTACAAPRLDAVTPAASLPAPAVRRVAAPVPRAGPLLPADDVTVEVALLCAT